MSELTFKQLFDTVDKLKRNYQDRQPAAPDRATVHPDSWGDMDRYFDRQGVIETTSRAPIWGMNIYRDTETPKGIMRVWMRGGGCNDISLQTE